MVAGGVEERGGELDFEGFGALDEIDERGSLRRGWSPRSSAAAWASSACGLNEVFVGLGVFDERGRGADFAR